MYNKKQEKKAKKYVREQVNSVENAMLLPPEQRVEQAPEEFNALMAQFKDELERMDSEQKRFNSNNVLKHKLIHLYVSGRFNNTQIARMLGVAPTTISKWLSNDEVRELIQNYQAQEGIIIDSSLKALRMKAIKTLSELMDSENDLVALQATKDVLDRTGHKAIDKKEVKVEMTYEERIKNMLDGVNYIINDDTPEGEQNTEGEDISE
jgi:predicted transcriptional regulator